MQRLPAGNLIASASVLGGSCKFLQIGRRQARDVGRALAVDLEQMKTVVDAAAVLRAAADALGMVACSAAARDLGECFRRLPHPQSAHLMPDEERLDDLIGAMDYLLRTFRDEIDARPLFAMSPASAELYDQAVPLFGERVDDAFPSASDDVAEAGRCMAAGRWTASVMHLMRALETPLALLAADVGIGAGANWNKSLNEIEARLRTVSRREHGAEAEQWAAEAASQFRSIKNAWRNHAMHRRTFYDEERATEVYGAVRALLRNLSTRLSEDPAGSGRQGDPPADG
ncbi:hypothetical protein [Sphingomonas sp. TX0522]|uniref:hypothetical protein n=1 Tax=Sphingomonas sp. TX0522 TaxID=2479205 RepID=UPI0018DFF881|nr:hypothetical protein [Sphingomonas sp. TX0522]MBI0532041.1 hypothetical protein [Sphingomonas sp. TX0522]